MERRQPERSDSVTPPTTGDEVTRLAPSPTGALHLGNARTFLINWAMARRNGWGVVLRVEDLDGPRVDPKASSAAIDILRWLGLDWDGQPLYQSHNLAPYREALKTLQAQDAIYPCNCTRKDILNAQSAPHEDEHELRYPGTCRLKTRPEDSQPKQTILEDSPYAWRVKVPGGPVAFEDTLHGGQSFDIQRQVGDFVVASKMGLPAYQLAVVIDDARQGVTQVVRGDDLLGSSARQLFLYRTLGLGPLPTYTHLPLVMGPDGRRLAKRHGDTRVSAYREQGVSPEKLIGLLAWWSGIDTKRRATTAQAFAERFDLKRVSTDPVTMTQEDQNWLLEDC